jgi:hypothetical protein
MEDKVKVPVPDINEKVAAEEHQLEASFKDKAINYGAGFAQGVTHVAEGYLAIAEHPLETLNALNPVTASLDNTLMFAGAALGDIESQDQLARKVEPFVKAGEVIAEAASGDLTARGKVAGILLASSIGPVPPGAGIAAAAEKEMLAAEAKAVSAETLNTVTRVDNAALHANAPTMSLKDQLCETAIDRLRSYVNGRDPAVDAAKAAAFKSSAAGQLSEMLDATVRKLTKQDNAFKVAMDTHDSSMLPNGMKVSDQANYNLWNRDQVSDRGSFWKQAIKENPQLAETLIQQKLTEDGFDKLLLSNGYDAKLGIKPYNALPEKDEVVMADLPRGNYGFDFDRTQAKKWGIEWKEGPDASTFSGLAKSMLGAMTGKDEFGLNAEYFAAKQAVRNTKYLDQAIHREFSLGVINPDRAINPEIAEITRQLLGAKIENGTISAETRKMLPDLIRDLPPTKLRSLQERVAAVAPEQLRLEAGYVAPQLAHDASTPNHAVSAQHLDAGGLSTSPQHIQQARRHLLNELSVLIEQKPVAEYAAATPAVQAAQDKLNNLKQYDNIAQGATKSFIETVMANSGNGYVIGHREKATLLAEFAKSDYEGMKGSAEMVAKKAAMVVAVGGTAATVGLPAAAAVIAGSALHGLYKDMPEVRKALEPLVDPLVNKAQAVGEGVKSFVAATYQDVIKQTLPKNVDGDLTDQSKVVLNIINERVEQQSQIQLGNGPDR